MATSEVGIHHIQKQIDNCDQIVANVDKIVPKIYKIRQQALAQKEYINDIQRVLLTSGSGTIDSDKLATLKTSLLGNTLVGDDWATFAFQEHANDGTENGDNTQKQRQVFQSLFKFKHEIGTLTHFTSEQIGIEGDRTKGLNLSDVVEITTGLDTYLSVSNSNPSTLTADNSIHKLMKKNKTDLTAVNPNGGAETKLVLSTETPFNYENDTINGIKSILNDAITIATEDKIIGFGLN
tara:strand:+ start:451 stop:1161 length:711 start_codon:yes stop_codon:yes gene_type:complete